MMPGSEPYRPDNLLDRIVPASVMEDHYRHLEARERQLFDGRVGLHTGTVLSVGAGWHPGRHLFPSPAFRLVAVDTDPERVAHLRQSGAADEAHVAAAGQLDLPAASFDVVLYRLVLHHLVFQGELGPVFTEAARLLRPGGVLMAVEPGLWHPVGAALALANRMGVADAIHGTPDDIPLSPRLLRREALRAGLVPELHAASYGWRRLPRRVARSVRRVDAHGSRPRAALFGHTLVLFARRPA